MPDIVTFGEVLAEFMTTRVNQSLGEPGQLAGPYPGGAPAIFIDQAARLGCSAALVSCVGDDAFGRMLSERLAGDGVDVSHIRICPDQTTASAFVTYYDDGSRDFIFNIANSACAHIEQAQLAAALAGCKLLHVAGSALFSEHMIALAGAAIAQVKADGAKVSFDPNMRKEILEQPGVRDALAGVLRSTDILLPSDDELNLLTDCDDEARAVDAALALGVGEIVIKRGAAGCCHYDSEGRHDCPGFVVDEVDPTGAGDCFGSTFVTLRTQGVALEQALIHANAAGARSVSQQGAMEGTSSRAVINEFIESHARASTHGH